MISGRIGFVAGLVGVGLTGHRTRSHTHHPAAPDSTSVISEMEETQAAAASGEQQPTRRRRLLMLLKGTTF